MTRYLRWLAAERGLRFDGYDDLWRWSVADLDGFWGSIAEYFEVRFHARPERVLASRKRLRPRGGADGPARSLRRRENGTLGETASRSADRSPGPSPCPAPSGSPARR